jgi:hypothetical protein
MSFLSPTMALTVRGILREVTCQCKGASAQQNLVRSPQKIDQRDIDGLSGLLLWPMANPG